MKIKKEIARYCLVTPLVGTADFAVYYLSKLFLPIGISKGISYVCAGILGYLFSKYWVFKKRKECSYEMARYWAVDVFLLGYNVAANWTILYFWPRSFFIALAFASVSTAVLSFAFKKWWIFRSP